MNHQFDVILVIAVIFILNLLTMRIVTADRVPFGIRAVLGSAVIVITLFLAAFVGHYGR